MFKCDIFDVTDSRAAQFYSLKEQFYSEYKLKPEVIVNNYITKLFVVYSGDQPVCRASAILNPYIRYNSYQCGLVGHFESVEDVEAAGYLFGCVAEYFKNLGVNYIIGPVNGSTWHSYRLAEPSGFPPYLLDVISMPYYPKLFIDNGFEVIACYLTTCTADLSIDKDKYKRHQQYFASKNIVIRPFELQHFVEELKILYDLSVESFRHNFLYSEISFEEFLRLYAGIEEIIRPQYFLIAENVEKQPVGFVFCYDNMYEKGTKALVIKSLGRVNRPEARGLGRHLVDTIYLRAQQEGYKKVYHAMMHERNDSTNIQSSRHQVYRRYSLLGREI